MKNLATFEFASIKAAISFDRAKEFQDLLLKDNNLLNNPNGDLVGVTWRNSIKYSLIAFIVEANAINCFEVLADMVSPNESHRHGKIEVFLNGKAEPGLIDLMMIILERYSESSNGAAGKELIERWLNASYKMGWRLQAVSEMSDEWEAALLQHIYSKCKKTKDNLLTVSVLINCGFLSKDNAVKILNRNNLSTKLRWSDITDASWIEKLEYQVLNATYSNKVGEKSVSAL